MFSQPAPYRPGAAQQSRVPNPQPPQQGMRPAPASQGGGQPPNFQNRPNVGQFGGSSPSMGPATQPMPPGSDIAKPNMTTGTASGPTPPSMGPAIEPNTAGARMQGPSPGMGMQPQPGASMGAGLPSPSYPVMNKRPTGA